MPIDYKKYPKDWKQIRQRILLRSNNCCECEECNFENGEIVISFLNHNNIREWVRPIFADLIEQKYKEVKVVLTIAHLDHDETNHDVKDDRLKAMCQLCHLRYDAEEKKKRRLNKTNEKI